MLMRGEGATVQQIMESTGWQTTVNELLRLALLSPVVVRSILDGHQPKTLSLIWLKNNLLPTGWGEQHVLFDGFDA